jgi:hypothetical protein
MKLLLQLLLLSAALAALLLSGCSAAEPFVCPDSVKVDQKLAAPVPGWTATLNDKPHHLAGVTFFDGPPEGKVSLVYDKSSETGGKFIATWTFNPKTSKNIWVACGYSGTSIVLKKPLPPKTASCTVTYDAKQKVAGLPLLEKLTCK